MKYQRAIKKLWTQYLLFYQKALPQSQTPEQYIFSSDLPKPINKKGERQIEESKKLQEDASANLERFQEKQHMYKEHYETLNLPHLAWLCWDALRFSL